MDIVYLWVSLRVSLIFASLRWKTAVFGIGIILCLGSIFPAGGRAAERTNRHFYFVQISDTHFGSWNHFDMTEKIVTAINQLPIRIQCVVHTGDIMADRIEEQKLVDRGWQILQRLKAPVHFVPGNHDILEHKLDLTRRAYVQRFGGLITQAEYEGVVFIFVYTEPLRKDFVIDGYEPLHQLEELLLKSRGKPKIVFHHAPSVQNFYDNKFHRSWSRNIREKWVRLLNAHDVKAVIAGHYHRDEFHWLDEVPLYISSSVAGYWGRQASFRVYEYRNGKIGYFTSHIEPSKAKLSNE